MPAIWGVLVTDGDGTTVGGGVVTLPLFPIPPSYNLFPGAGERFLVITPTL